MVDMKFTKQLGRPRLRVAVLSPKLIPDLVDVVIGEFVYELQFYVETEEEANDPRLVDIHCRLELTSLPLNKRLARSHSLSMV